MENKRVYVYDSHLGGLYTSEEAFKPEICWTCGDYDRLLGKASSFEELVELVTERDYDENDNIIEEYCPYTDEYLREVWGDV